VRKWIVVVAALGLIVLAVVSIAVAQDGVLANLVQPTVVTIEQAVPVNITLALPQEDGSVITATAPITVGISLQVKIDGQGVVAVTTASEASPAKVTTEAVTTEAAADSAAGKLVDLSGIPYAVETDATVAITQVRSKTMIGGSMTQLVGELENTGTATLDYVLMSVNFYDADGNLLDIGSGAATTQNLAAGKTSGFQVIAPVDYKQVASYTIEIK
jgi:hypothetical protein